MSNDRIARLFMRSNARKTQALFGVAVFWGYKSAVTDLL
jgi:hypothetical protein